jgi:hypothetical protein
LTGNGLLVEFASPIQAAQCAVDVQRGMIDHKFGVSPDERIISAPASLKQQIW